MAIITLLDPTAQQIGIGGGVAVLMTAAVLKFLPAFMRALKEQSSRDSGERSNRSGDRSTGEWEGKMSAIATAANERMAEELMKDIRALMDSRGDKLREIIRQELSNLR